MASGTSLKDEFNQVTLRWGCGEHSSPSQGAFVLGDTFTCGFVLDVFTLWISQRDLVRNATSFPRYLLNWVKISLNLNSRIYALKAKTVGLRLRVGSGLFVAAPPLHLSFITC